MKSKTQIFTGGILLLAIGIAATVAVNAYSPVIQQYFDQQKAASNIRDEVTDSNYAVQNYEWFKTQQQKINSMQNQIENQRRQLKDYKDTHNISDLSYTQERQYNRMTNRLLGYQNQYENLVADYNARMNMETRNLYNDSLPLEMEKKFWTGDLIP